MECACSKKKEQPFDFLQERNNGNRSNQYPQDHHAENRWSIEKENGKTKYKVTGIMKPTGTVLDRLILTSLNSVLDIHGLHEVNNSIEKNHEHKHE